MKAFGLWLVMCVAVLAAGATSVQAAGSQQSTANLAAGGKLVLKITDSTAAIEILTASCAGKLVNFQPASIQTISGAFTINSDSDSGKLLATVTGLQTSSGATGTLSFDGKCKGEGLYTARAASDENTQSSKWTRPPYVCTILRPCASVTRDVTPFLCNLMKTDCDQRLCAIVMSRALGWHQFIDTHAKTIGVANIKGFDVVIDQIVSGIASDGYQQHKHDISMFCGYDTRARWQHADGRVKASVTFEFSFPYGKKIGELFHEADTAQKASELTDNLVTVMDNALTVWDAAGQSPVDTAPYEPFPDGWDSKVKPFGEPGVSGFGFSFQIDMP